MTCKDKIYRQTLSKLKTKLPTGAAAQRVLLPSYHLCFTNSFLQRERVIPGR